MNFVQTYFKYPGIWYFLLMTLTYVGLCGNHFFMKYIISMHHSARNELDQIRSHGLSSDIIAPSLTHIFNLSLETGIYVDDWKRARVTPIYKAKDKRKCENYRPISILPVVSKVFAREMFNQVYRYLCENSLLSRFQSGFGLNIQHYPL